MEVEDELGDAEMELKELDMTLVVASAEYARNGKVVALSNVVEEELPHDPVDVVVIEDSCLFKGCLTMLASQ